MPAQPYASMPLPGASETMPESIQSGGGGVCTSRFYEHCVRATRLVGTCLLLLAWLWLVIPAQAAVELLYFRAGVSQGKVLLDWETASEIDTLGFYVTRSQAQGGAYTRLNSTIIFAVGDSLVGAYYSYNDASALPNTPYWYRLEIVDRSSLSTFSDPVTFTWVILTSTATATPTVTPSATASSTSTATRTSTPIPTHTPLPTFTTLPTATASPTTPARQPTATTFPYIPPASSTPASPVEAYPPPAATDAPGTPPRPPASPTQPFLPPGSLQPFPTVTIQFPALVEPSITQTLQVSPPLLASPGWFEKPTPEQVAPVLGLVLAWLVLAALFYWIHSRLQ